MLLFVATAIAAAQTTANDAPSLERLLRAAMARDPELAGLKLAWHTRQLALARDAAGKGLSIDFRTRLDYGYARPPSKNGHQGTHASTLGATIGLEAGLPHPFGTFTASLPVTLLEEPAVQAPTTGITQPLGPLLGLDATESADLTATHAVVRAERAMRTRARALARRLLDTMQAILELRKSAARQAHEQTTLGRSITRMRIEQENRRSHAFRTLEFDRERVRRTHAETRTNLEQERADLEEQSGVRDFAQLGRARLRLRAVERDGRAPDVVDAAVELRVAGLRIAEHRRTRLPGVGLSAEYDWENEAFSAGMNFSVNLYDSGAHALTAEQLANDRAGAELALAAARQAFADALAQAERDIRDQEHRTWENGQRIRLAALKLAEARATLAAGAATPADVEQAVLDLILLQLDARILQVERWQLRLEIDALTDVDPLASVRLPPRRTPRSPGRVLSTRDR